MKAWQPIPLSLLACFPLLCLGSGCTAGAPTGARFFTRDSAGIVIAENVGELAEGEDGWEIAPEPTLQIGILEGDEAYMFQRIWGAVRLPDGRIAAADSRAADLRIFSPRGEHLQTFGRRGEGPGEFNSPVLMGALGQDTLVVVDRRLRRINLFHADEGFIGSATADPEIEGFLLPIGMFGSGAILVHRTRWTEEMANGLHRFPVRFRSVSTDGSLAQDFGEFPGSEIIYATRAMEGGSTVMSTGQPFGKGSVTAVAGDHFFYSNQDRYEIQVWNREGTLLRFIRRDKALLPVTEDDVAHLVEEFADDPDDSDQEREFRRMLREATLPDVHPALGSLYADALGYLWVEESRVPGDELRRTTVFDPEGRMVGRVTLPNRFQIQEIGADYLLGRWVDDLGVNYLRLYELTRPEGRP